MNVGLLQSTATLSRTKAPDGQFVLARQNGPFVRLLGGETGVLQTKNMFSVFRLASSLTIQVSRPCLPTSVALAHASERVLDRANPSEPSSRRRIPLAGHAPRRAGRCVRSAEFIARWRGRRDRTPSRTAAARKRLRPSECLHSAPRSSKSVYYSAALRATW